ncbi:hypothetical protein, partial [Actinomyces qiguomingii]|uniref:hypothetical protein n=1 Tax=Actinomyces qiguomingii TaxID=2057800 RepID=UPI001E4BA904
SGTSTPTRPCDTRTHDYPTTTPSNTKSPFTEFGRYDHRVRSVGLAGSSPCRGADYLLTVKNNQPALKVRLKALPWG